jgi:cytochrome P450
MFAAHTNTGATMGWTLAHIAQNKELQEKVSKEILQLSKHFPYKTNSFFIHSHCFHSLKLKCSLQVETDKVDVPTLSTLNKLVLLDCCMKETQRRYPLLFLFRSTVEPQEFEGYIIPSGEYIFISPLISHLNEKLWEDHPMQYKPERFLNEENVRKHLENKTYIQFGFGVHRCLGEKFANVVLKTSWFNLFKDYTLELKSEITPPNYKRAIGMPFSTEPIIVSLKKRQSHSLSESSFQ